MSLKNQFSINVIRPFALALLIVSMATLGCASRGGKTYSDSEVRQPQSVQYGTVLSVNTVDVSEDSTLLGPILGGVTGGILGSLVGGGTGKVLTTLGGTAAGALAGAGAEGQVRKYKAQEITVELDSGGTIIVVQGNDEYFSKRDKVRILTTAQGKTRVQHN